MTTAPHTSAVAAALTQAFDQLLADWPGADLTLHATWTSHHGFECSMLISTGDEDDDGIDDEAARITIDDLTDETIG